MEIKDVFHDLPAIQTERLILRKYKIEDAEDLYEYASDEQVTKYLSFSTYTSMDNAYEYIHSILNQYEDGNVVSPWVIELKSNNKMIGSIGINRWDTENFLVEMGYVLNKKYWGRGIMTEALEQVIKFAFENMDIERIQLTHDIRNIASGKVMLKNGLTYEGTLRKIKYSKNEFINLSYYSILREEYEQNKSNSNTVTG